MTLEDLMLDAKSEGLKPEEVIVCSAATLDQIEHWQFVTVNVPVSLGTVHLLSYAGRKYILFLY